jgi:hypothetical protein
LQHINVEEQLPAAEDDAVDDRHPEEEPRVGVECMQGLYIVGIKFLKHERIID